MNLGRVIESIKLSGHDFPTSGGDASSENPLVLVSNEQTGYYEPANMIHLFIKHWVLVYDFEIVGFFGNKVTDPDENGRVFDHVFYELIKNGAPDDDVIDEMFVFDITEPLTALPPDDYDFEKSLRDSLNF